MAVVIFSVAGSGRQISVSLRPAWSSTVPGQVPKLQRILVSEKKKIKKNKKIKKKFPLLLTSLSLLFSKQAQES